MIKQIILFILNLSPVSKRWFWKKWYDIFAERAPNAELKLMNYGYDSDAMELSLKKDDEQERYPIQLYHYVCSHADIRNKNILEVGSGRGGGASYIARYLSPKSIKGIDISPNAINLCNKFYNQKNLSFTVGDSENIPFKENSHDIVINVESSHCYGSMTNFLNEVNRVLIPGGMLLFCDFRSIDGINELYEYFNQSNLKFVNRFDITSNILRGLDKLSDYRKSNIQKRVPVLIRNLFESYAGVKNTDIYNGFKDGEMLYVCALLKK